MDLRNKRILVTGAAGFIGMHTCAKLIEQGAQVLGLDNLNAYYSVALKQARLAELGILVDNFKDGDIVKSNFHQNFRFVKTDLENMEVISKLFESEKFDYVVHLAAQAGVRYSIENPHAYISSNIQGFLNIIEACRTNHVKHLLYASSSSVYGLNSQAPFNETQMTDKPASLYAATKKSNELMAHVYSHLYKLPTTGLRLFTVYGPWGRPDMALFRFTDKILNDQLIEVFGDGTMTRDFTYIDDVVDAIVRCIERPDENPDVPHQVFNVGNASPRPVLDYIKAIERSVNKKAFMTLCPAHPADVHDTHANIGALSQHCGYHPATSIETGVALFVEWYKRYYWNGTREAASASH